MNRLDTPAIVTAVAVFVALLLLLEGLYLLWRSSFGPQARRLSQRLKTLSQERDRARAAAWRVSASAGPLAAWLQQLPARLFWRVLYGSMQSRRDVRRTWKV
jgi:hypothetical protein